MKCFILTIIFSSLISSGIHSQPRGVSVKTDIVYGRKLGMALTMDVFTPETPTGSAVVFLNSGGFVSGKIRFYQNDPKSEAFYLNKEELKLVPEGILYPPLAQFSFDELLDKGITVFDVRHGSSPIFKLDEIVDDCRCAVEYIRSCASDFGIHPEKIGLFGASAGGYLAAYLSVTGAGVNTSVLYYPAGYNYPDMKVNAEDAFNSLPALHLEDALLNDLSLKNHISYDDPPMLIIYGEEDFPFITKACTSISEDLSKANVEVKTIALPEVGHEFRFGQEYHSEKGEFARKTMAEWFASRLNPVD